MKKSNICRCCLADGCLKYLSNPYFYDEKLENYGELLTQTFNITLEVKNYICEECIIKLRDAAAFKEQILNVERTLNEQALIDNVDNNPDLIDIKIETETNEDTNIDYGKCYNDSDNDAECPKKDTVVKNIKGRSKKVKSIKQDDIKPSKTDETALNNSITLISNSNLCLFKTLRHRFACYACKKTHDNMKDLRHHFKDHSFNDFKQNLKKLTGITYLNADITNLTCNCSKTCSDLDVLRTHLIEDHKLNFGDTGHILKPYKIEDGYQCIICNETFVTFVRLSVHMNCHATRNICETCGLGFFNRQSFKAHVRTAHREHRCPNCSLIFSTNSAVNRHIKKVHNGTPVSSLYYCQKCDMTFPYTYRLRDHMVENHGAKKTPAECKHCGKVLKNDMYLKIHIRSVHLKERNHQCSVCDFRFFTKTDRVRHELTHQDISFACKFCESKFKSKDSERRHMKRQHAAK